MRAYTLATTPDSSERITPEIVDVFIDFVRTTRDPDVKGLVEAMEQELREHWLYERIYQGREVGAGEITSDSEVSKGSVS